MEFSGIEVSLDVATGLGLLGALVGWLLRKWHEDRMAQQEKEARRAAEATVSQERDDALVIKSLEPLNQAIQALHLELKKSSPDVAACQKFLAEIEDLYIRITISAASIASQPLYDLIVDAVKGHRKAVEKMDPKLVVLNGVVLFANLMERLREKSVADKAVQVLYGSPIDQVRNDYAKLRGA